MFYVIYGEIEFPATASRGKVVIRRFSSIRIDSSWKTLTDTAAVVLPRNTSDFDKDKLNAFFRPGDQVIIRAGYNGEMIEEFRGYISSVTTGVPVVINCEDEMYQLKRKQASISKAKCTIKQLLEAIAPGYKITCKDESIGSVRYSGKMTSEILDDIRSKLGLYTYFRGKTLVCGRTATDIDKTSSIILERQASESIKDRAVERVFVRVVSPQKKGKPLKAEKGDSTGNMISIRQPNLTQVEIDTVAKALYKKATTPGLDGDLTLFGIPSLQHGSKASIKSLFYPEKDGTYYIDSVTKTIASGQGYRQVSKLGFKA